MKRFFSAIALSLIMHVSYSQGCPHAAATKAKTSIQQASPANSTNNPINFLAETKSKNSWWDLIIDWFNFDLWLEKKKASSKITEVNFNN